MVHRLLLLTFLLLVSCSSRGTGDIIVESNLGEKTIIKRVTIAQIDHGVDTEKTRSATDELHINTIESLIETYTDSLPASFAVKRVATLKKEKEALLYERKLGNWYQEFAYTPIYIDLNGKKTAGNEKSVKCVDPRLSATELDKLSGFSPNAGIITQGLGNTVVAEINRQICSEFAVWPEP